MPDTFEAGDPIPYPTDNFYIKNDEDVIGGVPGVNDTAAFGVPNLVYEFTDDMDTHTSASQKIHIIRAQADAKNSEKGFMMHHN